MKDYSNIPFKNASIDRLTSRTTPPQGMRSMKDEMEKTKRTEWQKHTTTPFVHGAQEPVKNPLISRVVKSKVGREYEPKVRKRHMKP